MKITKEEDVLLHVIQTRNAEEEVHSGLEPELSVKVTIRMVQAKINRIKGQGHPEIARIPEKEVFREEIMMMKEAGRIKVDQTESGHPPKEQERTGAEIPVKGIVKRAEDQEETYIIKNGPFQKIKKQGKEERGEVINHFQKSQAITVGKVVSLKGLSLKEVEGKKMEDRRKSVR